MESSTYSPRAAVMDQLALLSSASTQREYEQKVPHAFIPTELIEMFTSDIYHPKSVDFISAFSEEELKDLAHLFGLLSSASEKMVASSVGSVIELQKLPEWRSVMDLSKRLHDEFQKRG